jgi:hypothetical protein
MADVPDPELAAALKAARKKPRNYVLIAKGTAAVKLIVQKKKVLAGDIQKAKTEAKGTVIVEGTCLGSGSEMVFEVVGDEPSIKAISIKDLISEQTELKLKPKFQVVKALTEVKEEDEEEGTNEGEGEEQPQPNASEVQNQALPPAPPPPPPTPTPVEPVSGNEDLLKTLVAAMGKLAPQLTTAITIVPTSREELMGVAAEFQKQIKAKDANGARESLLKLGQLVNGILSVLTKTPKPNEQGTNEQESQQPEPDAAQVAFEQRRNKLEPSLLEAQKLNREKAGPLGNVWQYALAQAEGGNYQNAMTAFDRLETAIRDVLKAGAQPSGSEGVVAAGVTRLELEQVRLAMAQGIGELEDALRATNDQRAWAVANLIRDLAARLPTELEDALGQLEQAVNSQNTEAIGKMKEAIRGKAVTWTQFLKNNADHIAGCEANPWNIPVRINAPIQKSLAAVMRVAA